MEGEKSLASLGDVEPGVKVRFGTAGIRGLYREEVHFKETLAVCYAVNELLGKGVFGVGWDTRNSSMLLANFACAAMNWYGSQVQSYGVVPTPVLAYNIKKGHLHAGFSVTASHNPAEYSGVKVFGTDGIEFSLEAEHKLERLIQQSADYAKRDYGVESFGQTIEAADAIDDYTRGIMLSAMETRRKFKILVDCANGAATNVTPKILSMLGHHVVTINSHTSSSFPGRLPEPMPETLVEVGKVVRSTHCDFGIAHDGDADRLVVLTSEGDVVPDYMTSVLILRVILQKVKHGVVVMSYNSSDVLESVARESGCTVSRSILGKTFQELYNKKGIFATEPSKMVDPRWGYWEDGIYSSVLLIQFLSQNSLDLKDAIKEIPKHSNVRANLSLSKPLDYNVVKTNMLVKFGTSVEDIDQSDGVKVRLRNGEGWLMLRVSGTENKVRIYCEAPDETRGAQLLEEGKIIAKISQG